MTPGAILAIPNTCHEQVGQIEPANNDILHLSKFTVIYVGQCEDHSGDMLSDVGRVPATRLACVHLNVHMMQACRMLSRMV